MEPEGSLSCSKETDTDPYPEPPESSLNSHTQAASMKMAVLWAVAPCSLVEVYQRFRGT
jgi:hypothetical protein